MSQRVRQKTSEEKKIMNEPISLQSESLLQEFGRINTPQKNNDTKLMSTRTFNINNNQS